MAGAGAGPAPRRRVGDRMQHGQYRVQSYASGRHLLEKRKLHAVAEFVVRYVGFIRDVLERYRRPGGP